MDIKNKQIIIILQALIAMIDPVRAVIIYMEMVLVYEKELGYRFKNQTV